MKNVSFRHCDDRCAFNGLSGSSVIYLDPSICMFYAAIAQAKRQISILI